MLFSLAIGICLLVALSVLAVVLLQLEADCAERSELYKARRRSDQDVWTGYDGK